MKIKAKDLEKMLDQIGLKQSEIAEALDIDPQTISRWKKQGSMTGASYRKLKDWVETGVKPSTKGFAGISIEAATIEQLVGELQKRGFRFELKK